MNWQAENRGLIRKLNRMYRIYSSATGCRRWVGGLVNSR